MQRSKLANAQREDGNVCRLFIELAVNWAEDYNATLPAYNKDTFSLARCSICSSTTLLLSSVPFSSLFPSLLNIFLFYIFPYCLCFLFSLIQL